MNLAHLAIQPSPIPMHAYAALLAIVIGGWQLYSKKGSTAHKSVGYIWVALMVYVSVSSFWIHTIKLAGPFSPIHLISIFTLWVLYAAIRAARQGNIRRHKSMMKWLYILSLVVTGLFTLLPGRVMHFTVFG
jgi:uncharacterized membrane protein